MPFALVVQDGHALGCLDQEHRVALLAERVPDDQDPQVFVGYAQEPQDEVLRNGIVRAIARSLNERQR